MNMKGRIGYSSRGAKIVLSSDKELQIFYAQRFQKTYGNTIQAVYEHLDEVLEAARELAYFPKSKSWLKYESKYNSTAAVSVLRGLAHTQNRKYTWEKCQTSADFILKIFSNFSGYVQKLAAQDAKEITENEKEVRKKANQKNKQELNIGMAMKDDPFAELEYWVNAAILYGKEMTKTRIFADATAAKPAASSGARKKGSQNHTVYFTSSLFEEA